MFAKNSIVRWVALLSLVCFVGTIAASQAGAAPADSEKSKPEVVVVPLTDADQEGIARQKVCPVMGTKLGEHGRPVKVLVDKQPVYLCCKGCLGRLKSNPAYYAAKAAELAGRR